MGISWQQNFTLTGLVEDKIDRGVTALEQALSDHKNTIYTNALSGQDYKGDGLAPYSKKYAAKRIANRRSGSVDLTITGNMLGSMDYKVTESGDSVIGEIYFRPVSSTAPKAFGGQSASAPEKAKNVSRKRPFFGISPAQVEEMQDKINEAMKG